MALMFRVTGLNARACAPAGWGMLRAMRALWWMLTALAVLALAYRYYSAFIAARILALDDARTTPAHTRRDGSNYHPTNRWVLFGQDRKSTRLNSSHPSISYAVFCLK